MGFLVTNDSGLPGTRGTIQMPTNASAPGTASNADGLWGSFFGAVGFVDTGSGSPNIYVRQSDGNWCVLSMTRDAIV